MGKAKNTKLYNMLVQYLHSPGRFYVKMSGEVEQDALFVAEIINSLITRQIWIVSSGMYWATPHSWKDSKWFFAEKPEVDEDDLLTMVDMLDAVQISERDFERLWIESISS